mgnify:CR=1 FL=1
MCGPLGHGVTALQAYLDAKCDVIDHPKMTFIVKFPFETSEARVRVPFKHLRRVLGLKGLCLSMTILILKFLWKNGGKWEGSWGAGVIGGQLLGIGRSFMMM